MEKMMHNFSTEELFEILSEGIHDDTHNQRHNVIKNFDLNFELIRKTDRSKFSQDKNINRNKNICVVYSIWDSFAYLKYAYLSILSNYIHTDLNRFPLKVVMGGKLADYGERFRPIFEELGAEVKINREYKFKHTLPNIFHKYDLVFNVDADLFFFGGHKDIYSKISNYYFNIENSDSLSTPYIVYGEEIDWKSETRFFHPMDAVPLKKFGIEPFEGEEEEAEARDSFIEYWADCKQLSLTETDIRERLKGGWMWNLFSVYNPKIFLSNRNWRRFYRLCKKNLEIWDDEFVYSLWLWNQDRPETYLNVFRNIKRQGSRLSFLDSSGGSIEKVGMVHPVNAYKDIKESKLERFFEQIQQNFQHNFM